MLIYEPLVRSTEFFGLDSLCPTNYARLTATMNLANAIERLRDVLRRQHKALGTESSYVYWLRQYVIALNKMPATLSSEQKLERFLTDLARQRDLAASTQNQAFNAVLFFYKDVLHLHTESLSVKSPLETVLSRSSPT